MKKILRIIVLVLLILYSIQAVDAKTNIETTYNSLYNKLEKKYKKEKDLIKKLEKINTKLKFIVKKIENEEKKKILRKLKYLNIEKLEFIKFKQELEKLEEIKDFLKNEKVYIVNKYWEFIKKDEIYKATKWFICFSWIKQRYLKELKWKNIYLFEWNICKLQDENTIKKKISYYNLIKNNKTIFLNANPSIILDWDFYNQYEAKSYIELSWYWYYDWQIDFNPEDKEIIIFEKDWKISLVRDYYKKRIIRSNLLENVKNKDEFLEVLSKDIKRYWENIDFENTIKEIKNKSEEIIKGENNKDKKIKIIYKWLIDYLKYDQDWINKWSKEIFSWLLSFENKRWVCDWYTKLIFYMLSFAGIDDIDIESWYVFTSDDFPDIWHSWIKIWDKYYDPTFDDPVWDFDKGNYELRYFWLAKDLIYADRFSWMNIAEKYKWKSKSQLEKISEEAFYKLVKKYGKKYNLLDLYYKKDLLWIRAGEEISIEKLKKSIPYYEVSNYGFIDENGKKRQISSINYFSVKDDNKDLNTLIDSIDLKYLENGDLKILKWNMWNGKYEYRLAYILKYH